MSGLRMLKEYKSTQPLQNTNARDTQLQAGAQEGRVQAARAKPRETEAHAAHLPGATLQSQQ